MRIVRAARYLFSLGLRVDSGRLVRAVVLMFAGYVAAPLAALALRSLTDSLLGRQAGPALTFALLAAALLVAQLMLSHFAHLDYFEVAELQQSRLRGELMTLVNGPPGIDHLDRADFADNTGLVRDGLFGSTRALEAVLQLAGLVVQTAITAGILIDLNPFFAFLPLCAVVPVLLERVAQNAVESAREQTAERLRLNKHLIELATSVGSVRELRLFGAEGELLERQRRTWDGVTAAMWRSQLKAACYRAIGQGFFALGYGGAIVLELASAVGRHASIGDLVLVITLAVQVSVQVSGALGLLSLLQTAGRTVERIQALRSIAASAPRRPARARVPGRLDRGITLEDVCFSYPGSDEPVLSNICLEIPAGQTLALVGENGAGKSTLVKLLCGLYLPTHGRILADGVDLADLDPQQWRARVATLFQDFTRIELTLGESIGHGDVARIADPPSVEAAVSQARAERVLRSVTGGLAGYVGRSYTRGAELSGGQWQTIGLARSLMRRSPLLLVLDEPAAALDASAEHELFERYASSAGRAGQGQGGVTVLVSHRFSTVLMADRIAVLEQGRLAESGSHRDLMSADGLYAELFTLQARAYGRRQRIDPSYLPSVPLTLLGLLERGPSHGYDLKRDYDTYFGRGRPLRYSQVYATLSRLARDGKAVAGPVEQEAGPERRRYAITSEGICDVERWLAEPAPPEPDLHSELFAKVVLALMLGRPADSYLDLQRAAHLQRMRELTELKQRGDHLDVLLADHAIYRLEADLRWIDHTAARLDLLERAVRQ